MIRKIATRILAPATRRAAGMTPQARRSHFRGITLGLCLVVIAEIGTALQGFWITVRFFKYLRPFTLAWVVAGSLFMLAMAIVTLAVMRLALERRASI